MYGPGSIAGFVVTALQAEVDLLLISYDGTQVYPALAALLAARQRGALPDDLLQRSAARLDRLTVFLDQKAAPDSAVIPAAAPPIPGL
jgi:hypothetical protein